MVELTGEYLKKYRELRGLTQEELAELTGQTPKTISNHENGKKITSAKQKIYLRVLNIRSSEEIQKERERKNLSIAKRSEFNESSELNQFSALEIIEYISDNKEDFLELVAFREVVKDLLVDERLDKLERMIDELLAKLSESLGKE